MSFKCFDYKPKEFAPPTQKCSYLATYFFSFCANLRTTLIHLANYVITVTKPCAHYALYLIGHYRYPPPLDVSAIQRLTPQQQSDLAHDPSIDWNVLPEKTQEAYIHTFSASLLTHVVHKGFSPSPSLWKHLILKLQQHPHAQVILPTNCFPKTKDVIRTLLPHQLDYLATRKTAAQWNTLPPKTQKYYIAKIQKNTLNRLVKKGFSPHNESAMQALVNKLRTVNSFANELLPKNYLPQTEEAITKLNSQEIYSVLYGPACISDPRCINIEKWNALPEKSQLAYLRKMGTSQKTLNLLFAGFNPTGEAKACFIHLIQTIRNHYTWLCDHQEEEIDDRLDQLKQIDLPSTEHAINQLTLLEVQDLLYGPKHNHAYQNINVLLWNHLCGEAQLAYLKKLGAGDDVKNLIAAGFCPRQEARKILSDYAKVLHCSLPFDLDSEEVRW